MISASSASWYLATIACHEELVQARGGAVLDDGMGKKKVLPGIAGID
jgi:hypothetical protein